MANDLFNAQVYPCLPCNSIDDILTFYKALGFEVIYLLERPRNYAVVQRGAVALHFYTMKGFNPADSYGTCYIAVQDVETLYNECAAGLRKQYGKIPVAGIPRITPLRNRIEGERRFNLIDPGGNWIRIGQQIDKSKTEDESDAIPASKLSRAVKAALFTDESKGDTPQAAQMLDEALAKFPDDPVPHRVEAWVVRATLAVTMGDFERARQSLDALHAIPLTDAERAGLTDEFERADTLADDIAHKPPPSLAAFFSEQGKRDIHTLATWIQESLNANWDRVFKRVQPEMVSRYDELGDAVYGLYGTQLFKPVHNELKALGWKVAPKLPGNLDISREWGDDDADRERWFWSKITDADGKAIGTIVTIYYHDHITIRIPRVPRIFGLTETGNKEVIAALSEKSPDFKTAKSMREEYADYVALD